MTNKIRIRERYLGPSHWFEVSHPKRPLTLETYESPGPGFMAIETAIYLLITVYGDPRR